MVISKKSSKKAQRKRIHKRLLDNGADEMYFRNTFGKQRKTVFSLPPSPTDAPAQNQQTGSSHRCSNPQVSSQTSVSQVDPGLGQATHTNKYSGQAPGAHPSLHHPSFQPGDAAPGPSGTTIFGQADPAYVPSSSPNNQYVAEYVYTPPSTESHLNAAAFYTAVPQIRAWNQADSQPGWWGMPGTTGYSQSTGAQRNEHVEGRFLAHHLDQMQQNRQQHSLFQSPAMYHPNQVGHSAVDDSRHLSATNSS